MVYTARSAALAQLELIVHLQSQEVLRHYLLRSCSFNDTLVSFVRQASLPPNWKTNPPPPAVRRIGDRWAASMESPVLAVPSVFIPGNVVSPEEMNFLLNPLHPDFRFIKLGDEIPIRLDRRLRKP